MNYVNQYIKKTPESAKMFADSARLHVNGVSHNIRYFKPHPFVVKSASNATLTDLDQNTYTDYWMGHWSLILGHAFPRVTEALHNQLDLGWMYGTVNEQTIKLSNIIADAIPVAEKTRYCTSGTEAAMYATRLARTHTKRDVIAKVDGGWHGYTSDLLKSVNWPFDVKESTGLVGDDKIISVPYNDLEASTKILSEYKDNLAGIIIEPVLGGAGCIPASKEYMAGIQEFVHRNGSLFIIDEVVTGFRFAYGCMYPAMSLDPDMVTLGKIIGGGMSIGAVCGKDEIMKHADTTAKDAIAHKEHSYIGGGTFSANPASMTAGSATLEYLRDNKSTYHEINDRGRQTRRGLKDVFGKYAIITGIGSTFMVHFPANKIHAITNAKQAARCDQKRLGRYHFKLIAQDGIFMLPGKMGAISRAHTKEDIEKLIAASEEFMGNDKAEPQI